MVQQTQEMVRLVVLSAPQPNFEFVPNLGHQSIT